MQVFCVGMVLNAALCTLHEMFKSLPVLIIFEDNSYLAVFLSEWFIWLSLSGSTLSMSLLERNL